MTSYFFNLEKSIAKYNAMTELNIQGTVKVIVRGYCSFAMTFFLLFTEQSSIIKTWEHFSVWLTQLKLLVMKKK